MLTYTNDQGETSNIPKWVENIVLSIVGILFGFAVVGVEQIGRDVVWDRLFPNDAIRTVFGPCGNPCLVKANHGGYEGQFFAAITQAKDDPSRLFIIDGPCASACVIFADFVRPNVCITDKATFIFHKGSLKRSKKIILRYNPPHSDDILNWVLDHDGFPADDGKTVLPLFMLAGEAQEFWPRCKVDNTPMQKADPLRTIKPQTATAAK